MKNLPLLLALFINICGVNLTNAQNVGIGTTSPNANALLHVDLGLSTTKGLLLTGTYNAAATVPNLGGGTRLMFYPGKGAFRVGFAFSNQWDNANVGSSSFATGSSTIAFGPNSTAMGLGTKAIGFNSLAMGDNTTALGDISTSFGQGSSAGGSRSTAFGYYTNAKGFSATVLGMFNDSVLTTNQVSVTSSTPLFIVGNGDADNNRSNAFLVRKDGNIGIGTNTPAERLSVLHSAAGIAASFTSSSALNNSDVVKVSHAGIGTGIEVLLNHPSNGARGISVIQSGVGPGVYSSSAGGNGLWGVTSSISAAGVIGDNFHGEAVVGRNRGGNGVGAVVGRNDSTGYGVRGFNTKSGIGVLGQSGISGGTGISGRFENVNAGNPSNALEGKTNGSGAAGYFNNSGSGAALVTQNGNVGIGTLTPQYALDVNGRMRLRGGGTNATSPGIWLNNIENNSQVGFMGVFDNNYIGWYGSNGASWNLMMNITNGNIGIGTQNPTQKLHVSGNICYSGSIGACSDIRYKENFEPLSNSLKNILSLHSFYYTWNKEAFPEKSFESKRQLGFSAQEIETLYPEIVQTDDKGYKAVDYSRLTPVLVDAIKEQQSEINEIRKENNELKIRLAKLERLLSPKK